MKKVVLILFVASLFMSVYGAAFVATAGYNIEQQNCDHFVTKIESDSLNDDGDTIKVCVKTGFPSGWIYLLKYGTMTGTGADSIDIDIAVNAYDIDGTLISTTAEETVTAVTGRNVALSINRTVFADRYTILMSSSTAAGTQILIPNISVVRVRYFDVTQK